MPDVKCEPFKIQPHRLLEDWLRLGTVFSQV